MRFQIGHTPETERIRIPIGRGVIGQVALTRQSILLNDVSTSDIYVAANPAVRAEMAVPLIAKNRLIGVMDIESEQANYFRDEHLHLLTLTASRIAQATRRRRWRYSTRLLSISRPFSTSTRCSNASVNCCAG
jgi:sigma-B regulation protein RsbU (phosphoserine phosphatase)